MIIVFTKPSNSTLQGAVLTHTLRNSRFFKVLRPKFCTYFSLFSGRWISSVHSI